ncbi:MAG: hypothetical protein P8179_17435, partial [Candidatus Thiodiazotropha sp.]
MNMPLNNAICVDRSTDINSTISTQQLDFAFRHRHIEIELLKRALTVAKKRLLTTKDTLAEVTKKSEEFQQQSHALKLELQQQESSEVIHKRVADNHTQRRKERFDEDSLQQSQKQVYGDKSIEQMQIDALQQSLEELQDELAQANKSNDTIKRELKAELVKENNRAERTLEALYGEIEQIRQSEGLLEEQLEQRNLQLAKIQKEKQAEVQQLQAKHLQLTSELQAALDEATLSARDNLTQAQAEISALQKQILKKESSRQQLQQEKAALGDCLQAETAHNQEFTKQILSLEEDKQRLEQAFKAEQLASKDTEHRLNDKLSAQKSDLDQAQTTIEELRHSHQQLKETLLQTERNSQNKKNKMSDGMLVVYLNS